MKKQLSLSLLLIIILISGCSHNSSRDNAENPASVVVAEAKKETIHAQFSYQAVLQLAEQREICAQIAGVVKAVHVKEGQLVNTSELLLGLKEETVLLALNDAQQEAVQARSREEQLQVKLKDMSSNLQRQQMLYDSGAVSRQDMEKVQLELQMLQHDVKQAESQFARTLNKQRQAELDLSNCRVTAPDNMIITETLVDAGQFVAAGQPLVRGGQARKLQMVIEVPGEKVSQWKVGDTLTVNSRGEERKAVISHISNLVLTGTSRIELLLQIDNHDLKWNPGEWAVVSHAIPVVEQIVVPLEAVAQGDSPYVYIIKNGRVYKQTVKLGTAEGSKLAVAGINAGTLVVKGGLQRLRDGQTVDYQKEDDPE